MKNKFITGLITGFTTASVVAIVISMVFFTNLSKEITQYNDRKQNATIQTEDGSEDATQVITSTDVMNKLQYLNLLIDNKFLNDIDDQKLVDGIYKGFVSGLGDPYSVYYTEEEFNTLMEQTTGVHYGIGVYVSQNINTGIITVTKPFSHGPGYEAGIRAGDIILKVNGEDVTGVDLSEVVAKIKGAEGTTVNITVGREGVTDPIDMTVERRKIEVETVEYQMLDNKIGYVLITEFDDVTDAQFRAAIDDLEKQGMKGLVFDVRNNLGGVLDGVVSMLDRLLPEGMIVYTEDKDGKREEYKSSAKESMEIPMAVVCNQYSASASEIFCGALQDYGVATIVGKTTFGKGIVQSVFPLSDGTAVKVTVSKYFTPNGKNIHGIGITPDIDVDLDESLKGKTDVPPQEDNQVQKAIEAVMEKMK